MGSEVQKQTLTELATDMLVVERLQTREIQLVAADRALNDLIFNGFLESDDYKDIRTALCRIGTIKIQTSRERTDLQISINRQLDEYWEKE